VKLQKEVLEGFGAFCYLLGTLENVVEICVERVQFIVVEEVTKVAMPRIFGLHVVRGWAIGKTKQSCDM